MKSISINLYKFNELSEEAKKTAIEKERNDSNYLNYNWYDFVYDEFKETAKEAGFDVEKMMFSISCSQGDGAMFEGGLDIKKYNTLIDNLPINKHVLKMLIDGKIDYSFSVKHDRGMYYHSNATSIDFSFDTKDKHININKEMNKFGDLIEKYYKSLCEDLYRELDTQLDYLMSDEAIGEHLNTNDYDFTENGEIYFV